MQGHQSSKKNSDTFTPRDHFCLYIVLSLSSINLNAAIRKTSPPPSCMRSYFVLSLKVKPVLIVSRLILRKRPVAIREITKRQKGHERPLPLWQRRKINTFLIPIVNTHSHSEEVRKEESQRDRKSLLILELFFVSSCWLISGYFFRSLTFSSTFPIGMKRCVWLGELLPRETPIMVMGTNVKESILGCDS